MKHKYLYMLAGAMAIAAACTEDAKESVKVTGVSFNPSTISMAVGDTRTLVYEVLPENASNKEVAWSSSKSDVAAVNDGVVTAHTAGETTISVVTKDGSKSAQCRVVVTSEPVPVTALMLSPQSDTLYIGQTLQLLAAVEPELATNAGLLYRSNHPDTASVSITGLVRALRVGEAVISVTTDDNLLEEQFTMQCSIVVVPATPQSVAVTPQTLSLAVNETRTITAAVLPSTAAQSVTWSSSNEEIATVTENGAVTGISAGNTFIVATTIDGNHKDTCELSVANVNVQSIRFSASGLVRDTMRVPLGRQARLAVLFTPANASNKTLTLGSSNTTSVPVPTMNAAGDTAIINALALGSALVYATSQDGSHADTCVIIVIPNVVYNDINRTGWSVTTEALDNAGANYGYLYDGGTGYDSHISGNPQHLIDNATNTYLAFAKPQNTSAFNGVTTNGTAAPSFTIDMGSSQEFNYILWSHKNGACTNCPLIDRDGNTASGTATTGANNYNYLRVYGVKLEGSNDDLTYTPILPLTAEGTYNGNPVTDIVWIPQKQTASGNDYYIGSKTTTEDAPHRIMLPASTYRYLKVTCEVNAKNYGTAANKYQHPDQSGDGYTAVGSGIQIAEFGLGMSSEMQ
jgi:uncharacterized protein YjdB